MLYMCSTMDSPWSRYFGVDDEEDDTEMSVDADDIEDAQMSPKDMHIYKSCPVFEEFILVKCQFCNSSLLPQSIKNHVEMRHTGIQQYEKDPEASIFRMVEKKPSLPTIPPSTLTPRASTAAFGMHGSRTPTSCSAAAFSADNQSEQYLSWPNKHGAFQQSPLNMTTNVVREKPENSKMKIVIPPEYSGKMSVGVSILAKNQKNMLELSASIPEMKPEPYNQSFSFSSTPDIMPSTSALASSCDMLSTSYDMPSTSKGLLPCQPLSANETDFEECMIYSQDPPSPSSADVAGSSEDPQQKAPALQKLVLRRVLQPDLKAPAERSQNYQGLTETNNDSQENYFMVVKDDEDCKEENQMQKKAQLHKKSVSNIEKVQRMRKLKHERNKLITKLFYELHCVKKKLDQCNRSKMEIERQLSVVKADLEETKRTTDSKNEALLQQNAKHENEIQILKLRNEQLTNSLEQSQIYTPNIGECWNFTDTHMSKQFKEIEDQKVELQRRIEELETESRKLKKSSKLVKGSFDDKLRQYLKIITDLKKRYDEQVAKSQELRLQRDFYQQYLSPKIYNVWRNKLASIQRRQPEVDEIFPGLLTPQPTPPTASPNIPLAEPMPVDAQIENENYISFQSQLSPEGPEEQELQEQEEQPPLQEVIQDEEVS